MSEPQAEVASYASVVERAWRDPEFKAKLLSDPVSVLTEAGIDLPRHKTVKIVENTADILHLVLPADPVEDELTDVDLEQMAGRYSCKVTPCCCKSRVFS
jgi:Nitrile hydratase, alpha chain